MKILLVDDEPMVRSSMARMVSRMSDTYIINEAEDGEEAVQLLTQDHFDLVITDIRMPAMDGIQLAKYIYKNFPQIYVVMLTGYADFNYAQAAIKYSVTEYLLKPVSIETLKKTIHKTDEELTKRKNTDVIGKLRATNLLEKRVQDLFYEMPVPYYDTSLFPEFRFITVISYRMNQDALKWKTARFSVKNVISDVLGRYGHAIVVVEESHLTSVLFSNLEAEPDTQLFINSIRQSVSSLFKIEVTAGIGGVTRELADIGKLYLQSLSTLGLTEQVQAPKSHETVHRLIRSALETIEQEFTNELTLTSLAERLFVNPNYLSSLFKIETGNTFTYHLTQARINKAKALLKTTNLKIYQICEQVGYADQAHFSRIFKSIVGLSPYEFREKGPNT